MTKAEWQRSTQSTRPTPTPGIRRLHPARDHRFLAMHLKEAPPAVPHPLAAPHQDQEDALPGNQAYGSSSRSRWQSIRPSRGHNDGSRSWSDRRQQGQATPRSQSPSGSGWMQRQGGPRFPAPHPGRSWTTGQGGPRFRPPASGNTGNWRPGWRSSSGDHSGQQPAQQQYSSGQRRWSQGSADQQPPATVNTPPPRRRGCYVCGQPGCHSDFHGPGAVSLQAPPAMGCFVCGQRGCHSSRHEANV